MLLCRLIFVTIAWLYMHVTHYCLVVLITFCAVAAPSLIIHQVLAGSISSRPLTQGLGENKNIQGWRTRPPMCIEGVGFGEGLCFSPTWGLGAVPTALRIFFTLATNISKILDVFIKYMYWRRVFDCSTKTKKQRRLKSVDQFLWGSTFVNSPSVTAFHMVHNKHTCLTRMAC